MTAPDRPARHLTRPSDVRALLAELGLQPSKVLGQNFLVDANIIDILADAGQLTARDRVVEVGPGLGALTAPLVARAGHVLAIEKDERLARHIAAYFPHAAHLEIRHMDALDVDWPTLFRNGTNKFMSNLPYSVGSRILMDVFVCDPGPERMVVTVQDEVADRLAARPGSKDYGLLGICAQVDYDVTIRKVISPTCFLPPPQVKSAIVVMERRQRTDLPVPDRTVFRDLVRRFFSHRRKQLQGILAREQSHLPLEQREAAMAAAGAAPMDRPENLSVEQWLKLVAALTQHVV